MAILEQHIMTEQDIQPVRDYDVEGGGEKAKLIYLKALKKKQKDLITKLTEEDEKDGLYEDNVRA